MGFLAPTTPLGKVRKLPGFKQMTPDSRCSILIGPSTHPLFWFPHCCRSTSDSLCKLLTPSPLSFHSQRQEPSSTSLVLGPMNEERKRYIFDLNDYSAHSLSQPFPVTKIHPPFYLHPTASYHVHGKENKQRCLRPSLHSFHLRILHVICRML